MISYSTFTVEPYQF